MVDRAVVVPALLYGSEMWTVYSRLLKVLEQYHPCCLCARSCESTGKTDASTPASSHQANIPSTEALTTLDAMVGCIVRVTDTSLPEQLQNGRRAPGGQRKRFSDTLKASLGKCGIPMDTWESLAQGRPKYRRSIREGVKHLEICRWEKAGA
eukprot:g24521.t1